MVSVGDEDGLWRWHGASLATRATEGIVMDVLVASGAAGATIALPAVVDGTGRRVATSTTASEELFKRFGLVDAPGFCDGINLFLGGIIISRKCVVGISRRVWTAATALWSRGPGSHGCFARMLVA